MLKGEHWEAGIATLPGEATVHGALFRLLSIYCVPGTTESLAPKRFKQGLDPESLGALGKSKENPKLNPTGDLGLMGSCKEMRFATIEGGY